MAQFHSLLTIQEVMLSRYDAVPLAERRSLNAYLWDFACREWTRCDSFALTSNLLTHPLCCYGYCCRKGYGYVWDVFQ